MVGWFYFFEILGIISFSTSGAMLAIKKQFDIFGVVVLAITTALGGGVIRDIILGINPPSMFRDFTYSLVALLIALIVFVIAYFRKNVLNEKLDKIEKILNLSDAIGLGVFVVTGVNTSLINGFGDNFFLAIFVGLITGIGGGILRDIMVGQIPFVLHKKIYAVAALAGAVLYYTLFEFGMEKEIAAEISIFMTIIIRMAATHYKWNLPRV